MITHADWYWEPKWAQQVYKPENRMFRSRKVGMWYAFLKYKMEMEGIPKSAGMIKSVTYVFPDKKFDFSYNDYVMSFHPDIEVYYEGAILPEYHTLATICGGTARMYRWILHQHPFLRIRVIEPPEFAMIIANLKLAGNDLDKEFVQFGREGIIKAPIKKRIKKKKKIKNRGGKRSIARSKYQKLPKVLLKENYVSRTV